MSPRRASVIILLAVLSLLAPGAHAAPATDTRVLDVKASNLKQGGTLLLVKVSYTCPRGQDVLVQATLNNLQYEQDGVVGLASFGALDEEATCTGHRQKSELALPVPDAFEGARFVRTSDVRAMGFLRVPGVEEPFEGGPFLQDIHGPK